MTKISYRGHRFPPEIIRYAVWLYFRFPLSFRDVEDFLVERSIDVSYETVRRWSLKFGLAYAKSLRASLPRPDARWHVDVANCDTRGLIGSLMAGLCGCYSVT